MQTSLREALENIEQTRTVWHMQASTRRVDAPACLWRTDGIECWQSSRGGAPGKQSFRVLCLSPDADLRSPPPSSPQLDHQRNRVLRVNLLIRRVPCKIFRSVPVLWHDCAAHRGLGTPLRSAASARPTLCMQPAHWPAHLDGVATSTMQAAARLAAPRRMSPPPPARHPPTHPPTCPCSIMSLGGVMATLPAAFFGMNLSSGLEEQLGVFWPVVQVGRRRTPAVDLVARARAGGIAVLACASLVVLCERGLQRLFMCTMVPRLAGLAVARARWPGGDLHAVGSPARAACSASSCHAPPPVLLPLGALTDGIALRASASGACALTATPRAPLCTQFGPKRRYRARLRDMRSLRDLLIYHLDDLDDVMEQARGAQRTAALAPCRAAAQRTKLTIRASARCSLPTPSRVACCLRHDRAAWPCLARQCRR